MDEETDKFIAAVNSHSPLWDMRDKRYHSRDIQRKLWAKVAVEMGSDVATLKKKWKGLRDSFRREHKKFLKSGQEAPDEFVSSWPFFEQMLFLSDIMHPRELKGNVSPPAKGTSGTDDSQDTQSSQEDYEYFGDTDQEHRSETEETDPNTASIAAMVMAPPTQSNVMKSVQKEVETKKLYIKKANSNENEQKEVETGKLYIKKANSNENEQKEVETKKLYLKKVNSDETAKAHKNSVTVIPVECPPTPRSAKRAKAEIKTTSNKRASAKAESCDAEFLKIEKEKLQLFSESVAMKSDSDYQFLLSLLPYLKKIPENRKLSVRNKIQQVLINEEELSFGQHQCPVPYASPYNVAYPPSNSSYSSGRETSVNTSDVTTQLPWTSEGQPDNPPLPSRDYQLEQQRSLLTLQPVKKPGPGQTNDITHNDELQPHDELRNFLKKFSTLS